MKRMLYECGCWILRTEDDAQRVLEVGHCKDHTYLQAFPGYQETTLAQKAKAIRKAERD